MRGVVVRAFSRRNFAKPHARPRKRSGMHFVIAGFAKIRQGQPRAFIRFKTFQALHGINLVASAFVYVFNVIFFDIIFENFSRFFIKSLLVYAVTQNVFFIFFEQIRKY